MTTLIVTAIPADGQGEAMGRYLQGVQPLLMAAGGTPVKRLRVTSTLAGTSGAQLALVMDFENAETVSAVFASDDYNALVTDWDTAFSNIEILIAEAVG